jgi:hypothetical protein
MTKLSPEFDQDIKCCHCVGYSDLPTCCRTISNSTHIYHQIDAYLYSLWIKAVCTPFGCWAPATAAAAAVGSDRMLEFSWSPIIICAVCIWARSSWRRVGRLLSLLFTQIFALHCLGRIHGVSCQSDLWYWIVRTSLLESGTSRGRDFSGEKSLPHRSEYERSAIDL